MRLYLIRHGQSQNNALENIRMRFQDPLLTPIGEQQAHLVADYLLTMPDTPVSPFTKPEPFNITQLYVSPMRRALQTAQPISYAFGLPMKIWVDVHEWGGMFLEDVDDDKLITGYTGMTRSQIEEHFPEAVCPDNVTQNGWWDIAMGRESVEHAVMRSIRVVLAIREHANSDEHIAIVTHGGFIDSFIKALLDQAPRLAPDLFYLNYNTGVTRIDFNEKPDKLRITYLNRVDHLPHDLRTI